MGQGSSSIGAIRKKITKTYELISCAYHESSHTVYSLLHMMRVSSVVVFENKKAQRIQGITYYEYPCDFDGIQDKENALQSGGGMDASGRKTVQKMLNDFEVRLDKEAAMNKPGGKKSK